MATQRNEITEHRGEPCRDCLTIERDDANERGVGNAGTEARAALDQLTDEERALVWLFNRELPVHEWTGAPGHLLCAFHGQPVDGSEPPEYREAWQRWWDEHGVPGINWQPLPEGTELVVRPHHVTPTTGECNPPRTIDLAQAIVSMAAAAQQRRDARHELAEASTVVAKTIAKELRNGDSIPPKRTGRAAYVVVQVFDTSGSWCKTLARILGGASDTAAVFSYRDEDKAKTITPQVQGWPADREFRLVAAQPADMIAFAEEAGAVAAAFKFAPRDQAASYTDAAQRLVSIVPARGTRRPERRRS
jgi:hypothetical protein